MKTLIPLILLAAILAGCSSTHTEHPIATTPQRKDEYVRTTQPDNTKERKAIENVLSIRFRVVTNSIIYVQGRPNGKVDRKKGMALMRRIDVSNCPKDFQLAWADYIFALLSESETGGAGWLLETIAGVAAAPTTGGASLVLLGQSAKEIRESDKAKNQYKTGYRDAWHQCVRSAIEHDVKVPPHFLY